MSSDDFGKTWQPFAGGLPVAADCVATIAMDYATRDTLYASTCQGIYRWNGAGWELVSTRRTGKMAVTYGDPQRLLTTVGGVTRWAVFHRGDGRGDLGGRGPEFTGMHRIDRMGLGFGHRLDLPKQGLAWRIAGLPVAVLEVPDRGDLLEILPSAAAV